ETRCVTDRAADHDRAVVEEEVAVAASLLQGRICSDAVQSRVPLVHLPDRSGGFEGRGAAPAGRDRRAWKTNPMQHRDPAAPGVIDMQVVAAVEEAVVDRLDLVPLVRTERGKRRLRHRRKSSGPRRTARVAASDTSSVAVELVQALVADAEVVG